MRLFHSIGATSTSANSPILIRVGFVSVPGWLLHGRADGPFLSDSCQKSCRRVLIPANSRQGCPKID
jgi:hypothetical protein